MSVREDLASLADSVFAKEKADLVILGEEDSSGVPVEDRMTMIREEHEVVEYRLVPADTLRAAVVALSR